MRLEQLSQELDVPIETIQYFTEIGILKPSVDAKGVSIYTARDRNCLHFTVRARQLGFSMDDIREIIELSGTGFEPCQRARELMRANLEKTEQSHRESQALRDKMQKAIKTWSCMEDSEPTGEVVYQLIESWDKELET